jgi:hypothetical protein
VVESAEASDRFLWDFRRTLVDMFAEEHYHTATEFFHKQGVQTYSEASGVSLEPLEDALLSKKQVDIPMGEFWFRSLHPWNMYYVGRARCGVGGARVRQAARGGGVVDGRRL